MNNVELFNKKLQELIDTSDKQHRQIMEVLDMINDWADNLEKQARELTNN